MTKVNENTEPKRARGFFANTPLEKMDIKERAIYIGAYVSRYRDISADEKTMMTSSMWQAIQWAEKHCLSTEELEEKRKIQERQEKAKSIEAINTSRNKVKELRQAKTKTLGADGTWRYV